MKTAGWVSIIVAAVLFLIAAVDLIGSTINVSNPSGSADGILAIVGCAFLVSGLALVLHGRQAPDPDAEHESLSILR
jgi:hypothetical protein